MHSDVDVPRRRRTGRDWMVDLALFGVAVFSWIYISGERLEAGVLPPQWLFELDQLAGLAGIGMVWLRRRWPVPLAIAAAAASSFSETIAFPLLVLLFSVTAHCRPRSALVAFALAFAAGLVHVSIRPDPSIDAVTSVLLTAALVGAPAGWGLFVRYRLKLRARQEDEERMHRERARQRARDEIARELHDMLGHRLSLLSLHAGALEYRPDAPASELAQAAGVVREHSQLAMRDLREVIGVLRAPIGELPQPTLADLRRLVDEARAGMSVMLDETVDGEFPERIGRTAYRIVQESLTNARKHAAGAEVRVLLAGAIGGTLAVEVVNDAGRPGGPDMRPGHGLIGLEERTTLVGGRLEYGPTDSGGWAVRAWLPWSA
jgi:signal transduction histidine kinase